MADQETLYSRWLNGSLSEDEILKLKESGEEFKLNNIIKAVDMWESEDIDLDKAYDRHIEGRKNTTRVRKLITGRSWMVAASILFILASILLLNNSTDYTSAFGENEIVALSDGTSVILNDGSTLTQMWNPFSKQRAMHLKGEALFKVTKGEKFIVKTEHGNVEVLGTEFNVRTWGNRLAVECYEGKVRVTKSSHNVTLQKGDAVSMIDGVFSSLGNIENVEPKWTNEISAFDDESIRHVFEEMERQFNIDITIGENDKKFTGQFTHSDINAALDAICIPLGLQYEISTDQKQ